MLVMVMIVVVVVVAVTVTWIVEIVVVVVIVVVLLVTWILGTYLSFSYLFLPFHHASFSFSAGLDSLSHICFFLFPHPVVDY